MKKQSTYKKQYSNNSQYNTLHYSTTLSSFLNTVTDVQLEEGTESFAYISQFLSYCYYCSSAIGQINKLSSSNNLKKQCTKIQSMSELF